MILALSGCGRLIQRRLITSMVEASSTNLNLSSTGTLSVLLFDAERYSRIPSVLPCGPLELNDGAGSGRIGKRTIWRYDEDKKNWIKNQQISLNGKERRRVQE